jgi:hypothetical protein
MKYNALTAAAAAMLLMAGSAYAEDKPATAPATATTSAPAPADGKHMGKHKGMMFEMMDTNHDGSVSKDEFTAHHTARFDKMDANHDGSVNKEEIEAYRAAKKAEWEKMKKDGKEAPEDGADE